MEMISSSLQADPQPILIPLLTIKMFVPTNIFVQACICVCVCMCMYVCRFVFDMSIYTFTSEVIYKNM